MVLAIHPATQSYWGIPGYAFAWAIVVSALCLFSYVLSKRYLLLRSAQSDPRFSQIGRRLTHLITYGLIQKRQPRYLWAGLIHIIIFWGFIILALRSVDLISQGLNLPFLLPLMERQFGSFYNVLKDMFELIVLITCQLAILRRAIGKAERYEGSRQFEAYFVLCLIAFLMVTDMFYEGSALLLMGSAHVQGGWLPASQVAALLISGFNPQSLKIIHTVSYWLHIMTFFFFLDFLPFSKHFHIITALPNIFFRKLRKGLLKPARWGVEDLEDLDAIGVEKFEDFTWKHILDFFTCTECGRCSDQCPANAIGRPLSPKMISIKLRDYGYGKRPFLRRKKAVDREDESLPIVGGLIGDSEIWSCTTCGACEEECPVFIEYIDKIIDMRRHFIETSQNPKTFNQVLMHFEKTGNPFGKPRAKRAEWVKEMEVSPVRILNEGDEVDVLYYVDSYASYDPRIQNIASCIAKGLYMAGIEFGILGPTESDSGHQVRRIGEEGLFQLLMEENMEAIQGIKFKRVITTDPHAFNTLTNDYSLRQPVIHYSQFFFDSGRKKVV